MSQPFYVSPEQLMKDKSDYARKGIARGRSVLTLAYADGILFVGENPSNALHKISEIYDRIAFAAVGKYNEFENLRLAGVRYADLRGYSYDRADVTARGLANVYAQTLGTIFSSVGEKPYEVELIVAEVGKGPDDDQVYRLTPDGSVVDEHNSVVVGGNADSIGHYLRQRHRPARHQGRRAAGGRPGREAGSQGLRTGAAPAYSVEALKPNSGSRDLPSTVTPRERSCVTTGPSDLAGRATNASVPWLVGSPFTSALSLTNVGTPAKAASAPGEVEPPAS